MIATSDIVSKVRRLLNEAESDEQLTLLSEDTRSMDDHIVALLPQAVALTQRNKGSGAGCVNARHVDPDLACLSAGSDGCAVIALPRDFYAVVSVQLNGWRQPCTELVQPGSTVAIAQSNEHTRTGTCRPVAVECMAADGSRVAKLYPLPGSGVPRLDHFVYEAEFNAADGLDGCSRQLADAVAYNCAALLYNVFERPDAANMFLSLASALCNGNNMERK